MNDEEYGKAAYEEAQKHNYRYTEDWYSLPREGKRYWTAIAVAVLKTNRNRTNHE